MFFPYLLHVSLPQGNTRVFLLALTSATQEWHSERQSSSEIYRMLQAAGFEAQCLVENFFFDFWMLVENKHSCDKNERMPCIL